jgi:hypothetical protein
MFVLPVTYMDRISETNSRKHTPSSEVDSTLSYPHFVEPKGLLQNSRTRHRFQP